MTRVGVAWDPLVRGETNRAADAAGQQLAVETQ